MKILRRVLGIIGALQDDKDYQLTVRIERYNKEYHAMSYTAKHNILLVVSSYILYAEKILSDKNNFSESELYDFVNINNLDCGLCKFFSVETECTESRLFLQNILFDAYRVGSHYICPIYVNSVSLYTTYSGKHPEILEKIYRKRLDLCLNMKASIIDSKPRSFMGRIFGSETSNR